MMFVRESASTPPATVRNRSIYRLRVEHGESIEIADEQVTSANLEKAEVIQSSANDCISLTEEEARWVLACLAKIFGLEEKAERDAETIAQLRAELANLKQCNAVLEEQAHPEAFLR